MVLEKYLMETIALPTETLGSWYHKATRTLVCKTMELPWRNNVSSSDPLKASCIPRGLVYIVKKQPPGRGRKYGYFRIKHVPGRNVDHVTGMSRCLVHPITLVSGLLGCIGVGSRHVDINKDGVPDMVDSTNKLKWMYDNLPDEFELEIIDVTKKS